MALHTVPYSYTPESRTAWQSVYTDQSYKSLWKPRQSSSNLFVWNWWWISSFQQTQRRPYPHLFVHVKARVISWDDWLDASGGVCVCTCLCVYVWECSSLSHSMSDWRLAVRLSVPLRHPICLCHCARSLHTQKHKHSHTVTLPLLDAHNAPMPRSGVFDAGLFIAVIKFSPLSTCSYQIPYFFASLCHDRRTDSAPSLYWSVPWSWLKWSYLLPSFLASHPCLDPDRAERHTRPAPYSWQSAAWCSR